MIVLDNLGELSLNHNQRMSLLTNVSTTSTEVFKFEIKTITVFKNSTLVHLDISALGIDILVY